MPTKTTGNVVNFNPEQTTDLFSKVVGHSSLARLCNSTAVPFAGKESFIFTMDGEAALVNEGGEKPAGEASFKKVTIKPVKVVYQHRLTDEFMYLSDEAKIPYIDAFLDGFAKKIGRAIDIMAFHGVNPATKEAAESIKNICLDAKITNSVTATDNPVDDLESAVALISEKDCVASAMALSPAFAASIGKIKDRKDSNVKLYPEFAFGGRPESFNGLKVDVNNTVNFSNEQAVCYIGDFENAFKWGYAKDLPMKVIEFGDPDGQGDLQYTNEVVLRAEAYIGFGVVDPDAFSKIVKAAA